ncbi:alpha/beta hydrolase [Stieleria varia]|uniref:alpha/beta hydrolase n=1 Tax=Stieleria varia TaxID=2528005 RepID=UPI0018D21A38
MKRHWSTCLLLAFLFSSLLLPTAAYSADPQSYATVTDILYRANNDSLSDYARERCRLDVYHPTDKTGYPTVVWFHGGGLTGGNRSVPKALQDKGIAVVAVNYRLSPKVTSPTYVQDAAAAVAWTIQNISTYGGDPDKVFVSGHSAGGYLTSMVGLDKRYLAEHDIDADRLAGLIPYSGHTITHFTVRSERGIDGKQPIVDEMAPLYHVRPDAPPILLITGNRELEMLGRYEENAYLWRMLKVAGHKDVELMELDGYNHGQMAEPAHPLLLRFIDRVVK